MQALRSNSRNLERIVMSASLAIEDVSRLQARQYHRGLVSRRYGEALKWGDCFGGNDRGEHPAVAPCDLRFLRCWAWQWLAARIIMTRCWHFVWRQIMPRRFRYRRSASKCASAHMKISSKSHQAAYEVSARPCHVRRAVIVAIIGR